MSKVYRGCAAKSSDFSREARNLNFMRVLLIFKCGFNWLEKKNNEKGKESICAQALFYDVGLTTNNKADF